MSELPAISVLMPVYNAQRYVGAAVESILAQTFGDYEFIIVDDGSKDDSLSILQKYADKDKRIQILSRPNTGIVGALNDGLALCRADWIARMDADDWAYPTRFERQLAFMKEHPDYLAAGTDYELMDSDGDPIEVRTNPHEPMKVESTLMEGVCCLQHPTVIMSRKPVMELGGYRRAYQWAEDYDLFLRLCLLGKIANQPEALLRYRVHESSVCQTRSAEQADIVLRARAEAWRAKYGVEPDMDNPVVAVSMLPPELYRSWAHLAWGAGHHATATKYARRYLRHVGINRESWRLLMDCDTRMQLPKRLWQQTGRIGRKLPVVWRWWA
ncbi:MAG: glycosyltransferase [Phycisphaerales bacterium]|nr:glycosyltransferase [Phycisphaerales bacterium]